jgi:hypothetical protein
MALEWDVGDKSVVCECAQHCRQDIERNVAVVGRMASVEELRRLVQLRQR